MVLRLIIDVVRRRWYIGAFAVFQCGVMFQLFGRLLPSSRGMAVAMSGAWFMAGIVTDVFASRELYQLPVSRRTWWIARWWMSVLVTVLIAQLATAVVEWRVGPPSFGVEYTLLSTMFGILYCGFSMGFRTTSIAKVAKSGDAPVTAFLSAVAFLPLMILFAAAPFLLAPYLPHSFADLHTAWIMVLLVMAAFTVMGYRHHPDITARLNMRMALRMSSVTPVASGSPVMPRIDPFPRGFFARLTGAKIVLWEESRKQLIIFSTVIAIGIAWWAIGSQFRVWPPLGEVLRKAAVLPFSSSRAYITEPITFGFLFVIVNFVDVWMIERIRSLRTLPVSSTRLSSLPVVLALMSASMLWIVLLALHGLVLRTLPSSLRPDLFMAFTALTAMAHTIRFVTPGQPVKRSMLGLAPIAIILLTWGYIADSTWRPAVPQSAVLIGGLLTLAASWVVMRLAVTRSSSMYRPRQAVPTA